MGSEEELLKDSYEFYYAAVKELEEGIREKNTVKLRDSVKKLGTPLSKQPTPWHLNTLG